MSLKRINQIKNNTISELMIIKKSNENIIKNTVNNPNLLCESYKQGYLTALKEQNKSLKQSILCKLNIVNTPF